MGTTREAPPIVPEQGGEKECSTTQRNTGNGGGNGNDDDRMTLKREKEEANENVNAQISMGRQSLPTSKKWKNKTRGKHKEHWVKSTEIERKRTEATDERRTDDGNRNR